MLTVCHKLRRVAACFTCLLAMGGASLRADELVWRPKQNKFDAEIPAWTLTHLLRQMAEETGWMVYVEPETEHTVSARFKDVPPGEAMHLLFGDLNFALLPQTNATSKLLIYRTSLHQATQLILPSKPSAKPKDLIPNELVVHLKPNSKETIEALAARLGGKIVGRSDDLRTYRLAFADEAAAQSAREAFKADPSVGSVESNYFVNGPTQNENVDLLSPSNFSMKPTVSKDGSKVIVGLIDMPVQTLPSGMSDFLLPSLHSSADAGAPPDQLTHGTSMAETILHGLSLASKDESGSPVRILPVDVYGGNPNTTTFDVAKGVYMAINSGATIINMSLGGDGESPMLNAMIQDARKQGVLFFAAAGNDPTGLPVYPAADPGVIAVTAGDRQGNIAPYANRGNFVDLMAPGTSMVNYNNQEFLVTGTSSSTAYVSGAAAALRASGQTPTQVEATIRGSFGIPGGGKGGK